MFNPFLAEPSSNCTNPTVVTDWFVKLRNLVGLWLSGEEFYGQSTSCWISIQAKAPGVHNTLCSSTGRPLGKTSQSYLVLSILPVPKWAEVGVRKFFICIQFNVDLGPMTVSKSSLIVTENSVACDSPLLFQKQLQLAMVSSGILRTNQLQTNWKFLCKTSRNRNPWRPAS